MYIFMYIFVCAFIYNTRMYVYKNVLFKSHRPCENVSVSFFISKISKSFKADPVNIRKTRCKHFSPSHFFTIKAPSWLIKL